LIESDREFAMSEIIVKTYSVYLANVVRFPQHVRVTSLFMFCTDFVLAKGATTAVFLRYG